MVNVVVGLERPPDWVARDLGVGEGGGVAELAMPSHYQQHRAGLLTELFPDHLRPGQGEGA
jgi:hypothetical protein